MTWQKLRLVRNIFGVSALLWYPAALFLIKYSVTRNFILNWLFLNFSLTPVAAVELIALCAVYGVLGLGFLWALTEMWFRSKIIQSFSVPLEIQEERKVYALVKGLKEDSPLYKLGLRNYDFIRTVNGKDVNDMQKEDLQSVLDEWGLQSSPIAVVVTRAPFGQTKYVTLKKE